MGNVNKLDTYSKLVEVAHKEMQIKSLGNRGKVGSVSPYMGTSFTFKNKNDILNKYIGKIGKDELNIIELNLHITDNFGFLSTLNNLAEFEGYSSFRELLASDEKIKILQITKKLQAYYLLDKEIIVRKIKEVLIYQKEIIEKQEDREHQKKNII